MTQKPKKPIRVKPIYQPSGDSFSGWVGGKFKLAKQIIDIMPEHQHYVEVFAGAAWVMFKKSTSPAETINDINGELVNFYRVIKHHKDALVNELMSYPACRAQYDWYDNIPPQFLTDIQRAAKFYYVLRMSFGCKVYGNDYCAQSDGRLRLKLTDSLDKRLSKVSERLSNVNIEHSNYAYVLRRYDNVDTFFYLDPPYFGTEDYYGKTYFSRDDFELLASMLSNIKGKFLLSINDVPEIRNIFSDFKITPVQTKWTLARGKPKNKNSGKELFISNYTIGA